MLDNKKGLLKVYDNSFPKHKKAWKHLVNAANEVGWKDIHYMVLRLQKELNIEGGYKLKGED